MSVFAQAAQLHKRFKPRCYLALGTLILALTALLALAFTAGRNSAASIRDCGETENGLNSIANNPQSGGGCGSLDAEELITDAINGDPDDQAGVFAHFGLPSGQYERFKDQALMGIAKTNGEIIVKDKVVMTKAWSIGRVRFGYSQAYPIEGVGSYFKSMHTDVLERNIPVIVMFDESGTVQTAVLTSCGNPVEGEKIKPRAVCKKLEKKPVRDRPNTYEFTTEVETTGPVEVVEVNYYIDEGDGQPVLFKTESGPETPVVREFDKSATVIAKVTVKLPGGNKKVIESEQCKQFVEVKEKEIPPPPAAEKPKPQPEQPQVLPAKVEQPVQPLPITGPQGVAGLFVGTTLAGAIGHRLYTHLRTRK